MRTKNGRRAEQPRAATVLTWHEKCEQSHQSTSADLGLAVVQSQVRELADTRECCLVTAQRPLPRLHANGRYFVDLCLCVKSLRVKLQVNCKTINTTEVASARQPPVSGEQKSTAQYVCSQRGRRPVEVFVVPCAIVRGTQANDSLVKLDETVHLLST